MDQFTYLQILVLLIIQYTVQCNEANIVVFIFSFWHIQRQQSITAIIKRKCRSRIKWSEFQRLLSNKQFRRYFRMDKMCFAQLCRRIESAVGEDEFKSEKFFSDIEEA